MSKKFKFTITNAIASDLSLIERAVGFLQAATLSEAWIKSMQTKSFVLEAHHTTRIEGTQLTLAQSSKILSGKKVKAANQEDIQELLNYKAAFAMVEKYLDSRNPITEGLILEIHKLLVKDVRGDIAAPGEYRKIQNYVVNSQTKAVVYTPPPAYEVPFMMQELVEWISKVAEPHPILRAGIAQFQLVHIHPFLDGNGRTARLLSTLCLYRSGYDFKRLFAISEYYDRERSDYYQALQSVRDNSMDLTNWLEYFCLRLSTQMQEMCTAGKQHMQKDLLIHQANLSPRQSQAVEYLFANGHLNIESYQKMFPEVNKRTLQRDIQDMVERGIMAMQGKTNKLYYVLVPSNL